MRYLLDANIMANLLLIESPGKIKKLSQILGSGWIIKASMGHIRELADDGEDALGFDLDGDRVRCRYEARSDRAKTILKDLRQTIKEVTDIYIATDPDREGETIGWHIAHELGLKKPKRVTYSEITKAAVMAAIASPRTLDRNLVAAGRARDCLDKLVGYKGSKHIVWQLKNGAKSMGRVQSATLHLLCLREKEILAFKPQDYWSVWVDYKEGFRAFYRGSLTATEIVVNPEDDATDTNDNNKPESERVLSQAEADRLLNIARSQPHKIITIDHKNTTSSPPPPFITSTLQQAAGAKLRFSPEQTMKIAQSLYEAGYITYMRTDSVALSEQFCAEVRKYLEQHDRDNLPTVATKHRSKHNAQEAHEAIRPTDVNKTPEKLSTQVSIEEGKLYDLIWRRAVASQCRHAELAKTRIVTQSGAIFWEARGQVITFPGYTVYWNNLSGDSELPNVKKGQILNLKQAGADKKTTQPPPRYTEPKLVQLMERKGIGRPSTYSPTIKTLKQREYVKLIKGKLQPTPLGMELDGFLEKVLPDLIQAEFTAKMETNLDEIAAGNLDWEKYLNSWNREYFAPSLAKAIAEIRQFTPSVSNQNQSNGKNISTNRVKTELTDIHCPKCGCLMIKIFSKSQKLQADHFLKCDEKTSGCGSVMFLNGKTGKYELPYGERKPDAKPAVLTQYPCPVCNSPLEHYEYTKDGQNKVMFRCSNGKNRQDKCKEVAFFQTKQGKMWSPKFGELPVLKP